MSNEQKIIVLAYFVASILCLLVSVSFIVKILRFKIEIEVYQSWAVGWLFNSLIFFTYLLTETQLIDFHTSGRMANTFTIATLSSYFVIAIFSRMAWLYDKLPPERTTNNAVIINFFNFIEPLGRFFMIFWIALSFLFYSTPIEYPTNSMQIMNSGFEGVNQYYYFVRLLLSSSLFLLFPWVEATNIHSLYIKSFRILKVASGMYVVFTILELLSITNNIPIMFTLAKLGFVSAIIIIFVGTLFYRNLEIKEKLVQINSIKNLVD